MLEKLLLQNFRNYAKRNFEFSSGSTLIVGPNAVGKTNILEAIYFLATGKSFRAELEKEVIKETEDFGKITGKNEDDLEIFFDRRGGRYSKTFKVNGVPKRQVDFAGKITAVLFAPTDLEIVINSPATRRRYLDLVLSQVHKDYRLAIHLYEKGLRQRNRILLGARAEGLGAREIYENLEYWNDLLINNGKIIHERRREYLNFLNDLPPTILGFHLHYDHSIISEERLAKYATEEILAAATLVGPHRDDFVINLKGTTETKGDRGFIREARLYGSRGEQRLAVFELKLGELEYISRLAGQQASGIENRPILLLDDIFSELDHENRHRLLEVIPQQQTVMTTTDLHLVEKSYLKHTEVIQLGV